MAAHCDLLVFLIVLSVGHCSAELKGKFVQINDLHYDPTYLSGGGDSCHTKIEEAQRLPYGHYDCDASWNLTESALYKVDMESSDVTTDFIIWAGDNVMHVRKPEMLTADAALRIINATAHMVKRRVRSEVPVFPMLGNHDFFPKNQLPEHDPFVKDDFYSRLADVLCPLFIGDEACVLFRQSGYYSKVLENRLRVIILNSNLYSVYNNVVQGPDPAGQFSWLRAELQAAQQANQKVHLFAHIPPGMLETKANLPMLKEDYNTNFNKIIRDFAKVIVGVFCAHQHTDSFRVIYSEEASLFSRRPLVPLLINPSVTPQRVNWQGALSIAHNPALRSVYYNVTASDIVLKDYTQFYLPLDTANKADGHTIEWIEEYRFIRSYDASDLTAQSLHNIIEDFKKVGSNAFHKYFDLNSVRIHENEDKPTGRYYCSCACKVGHTCAMQNVDHHDYQVCMRDDLTCAAANFRSLLVLPVAVLVMVLQNALF